MITNHQNRYLENTVQTASPQQLLVMLCDGAIRFSKMGIYSIQQQNHADANKYLTKAQDIIMEFVITLDKKSPLAEMLLKLYDYFVNRLIEANIKKAVEPVEEILPLLIDLKETWVEAVKLSAANPAAALQHG
jgi:flagellar protein FliS